MAACYTSGDFKKYFKENMNALGAPVPTGLFDTYQKAIGTAATIVGTLHLLGKGATVGELIAATVGLEKLAVATAFGATCYVGVIIGSIAVASGRVLSCGSQMSDMFVFTYQNKLQFRGWHSFYLQNPQVLDKSHPFRKSVSLRATSAPHSFEYT
ncbi:hypothetical protein [Thalassomonas sp. RHCl1]|uniref:hypothetical protein n=1 Tax=Thalassomonas sp. RHCl1 TaxID=2995320 RepID=UPI00248D174A|nr:hypothetical protein [Thalassomonas sp. RHCl1]